MKAKIIQTRQVRDDGGRLDRIVLCGTRMEIAELIDGCAFALASPDRACQTSNGHLETYVEIENPKPRNAR
jgi:hypothetical protein